MKLLIVESPTKAKTISRFLDKGFKITSSFGHVRDLPKREMGIDIKHDFQPQYIVPRDKTKQVNALKKLAQQADEIYLATDEDREGEAIAWHLAQLLKPRGNQIKRITFHEITPQAIKQALQQPRGLDLNLVDAQQARRVLDRLVGYELSPLLWRKVTKGLSAGRVQSVAVRLVVDREREIENFKTQEYWTLSAYLYGQDQTVFEAQLWAKDGKRYDKLAIPDEALIKKIVADLANANYVVAEVEGKTVQRQPVPPFTTSTLQQAANNLLGFSSAQTMRLAQQLYEGINLGPHGPVGLITYMRTDSVNLSDDFIQNSRNYIQNQFGPKYLPETGRRFKTKAKGAQEAHEAIRPTDPNLTPEEAKVYLDDQQYKLYRLIWRRAVASQMASALLAQTGVNIAAKNYTFRATGSTIQFDGFLKIYASQLVDKILPLLRVKDSLTLHELTPAQHFTEPPPRYTEATLIKALEDKGIGRPSTYAPTLSTIVERNYVEKKDKKLSPTEIGILVTDLLVKHFSEVVDYDFTAKMENDLDEIAANQLAWVPMIRTFYTPFHANLVTKDQQLKKSDLAETPTDQVCERCGQPMVIKIGRFGKFLACTGYPGCKNTRPLGPNGQAAAPTEPKLTDKKCEKCGALLQRKTGRFGEFLACSQYPQCQYTKNIAVSTGITCPACQQGELIQKRSKRGRTFYGCQRYPACEQAYWHRPTGKICPTCGSLMVLTNKEELQCSNKNCKNL